MSTPRRSGLFAIKSTDGGQLRRLITNIRRLAGTERPPGSVLIMAATWLLAILDAGLLYVSFDAYAVRLGRAQLGRKVYARGED
jgi:hypothetical protein